MRISRTLTAVAGLVLLTIFRLDAARPFPPTVYDADNNRSIFIFSDQLGSLTDNEYRFAATHYVGCQKMSRAAIDRIRQYNEGFIHMAYKLGVTVDSSDTYWMIINGQWISDNYSEESNWYTVRQHEDWPLKNSQGDMVVHGDPYRRVIMDISNEEFREWWVNSCIEEMEAAGCDGVFADTYTVPALWGRTNYPQLFENDVSTTQNNWIPKLNDYGEYVYSRLDSAGYYFYPNIDNLQTGWADKATHYWTGENIHAAMLEGWGNWSNSTDAQSAIQQAAKIQMNGAYLHAECYFGPGHGPNYELTQAQQRMWLAGVYLLCNQGKMFLSMYGSSDEGLGMSAKALWFPEYEIDLGAFDTTWTSLSQVWSPSFNSFARMYEKGVVLVNVTDGARAVELDGTYWLAEDPGTTSEYWADESGNENVSLTYREVTSLNMPAYSAAVLLYDLPCTIEPAGDYDGSGALEMSDVVALLRSLRQNSEDPCLDYNGDGSGNIVDALDLLLYISRN